MKTNHQRDFVESRKSRRITLRRLQSKGTMKLVEIGHSKLMGAKSSGYDHANGHRGTARAKAGAKKFCRTRLRFNENHNLRKVIATL